LGVWTKSDGTVVDVVGGSPAFAAGVAPAMQIIAIEGHKWTIEAARAALIAAETKREPLELIVSSGDLVRTVRVDYHGGLQNPHLLRDGSKPDMLSAIIAPHRTAHGR
jgi:predicted metalloprotease with PDZ domain